MDENAFLIELSEGPQTDFGRVPFHERSPEQRVLSAVWDLESEVNNGGFLQYLGNGSGDSAEFAPWALREIGANACATLVESAVRSVSPQAIPADQEARERLLAELDESSLERLAKFDDAFYAYPDDLTHLLFEFVRSHPKTFGPV